MKADFSNLTKHFEELKQAVKPTFENVMKNTGEMVGETFKQGLVPGWGYDTGEWHDSFYQNEPEWSGNEIVMELGTSAEHSSFPEFGTPTQPAQYHFTTAMNVAGDEFGIRATKEMAETLEKIGR